MAILLRLPAVKERTGMSTSQIYAEMDEGRFPAPAPLFEGAKARGWFDDEIDAYVEARRKARDEKLPELRKARDEKRAERARLKRAAESAQAAVKGPDADAPGAPGVATPQPHQPHHHGRRRTPRQQPLAAIVAGE
jgi:prophage regulatory protein